MEKSSSSSEEKEVDERSSSDDKMMQKRSKKGPKRGGRGGEKPNDVPCKGDTSDDDDDYYSEAECVPNGPKTIECFICGAEMSKIHKLRQHMQLHASADNYEDEGKKLESAPIYQTLNPHKRNIEPQVIRDFLVQEVLEKRYSQFYGILSEAGVELHMSDSETDSEFEKEATSTANADNKLIPQNTYKCDLCSMHFTRRYQALFHQKTTHEREQLRFACDYCGRSFCGLQLLIHHLKTQCESDEHPISCVERFRQFLLKSNLQQFECLAQARKAVKIHRLTTAEKLYSCSVCPKTFLRPEHLTRHKAVHLPDELKMDCPVCFKKFNRKDNLRTHMKVHMDEAERDATNNQSTILCQYCGHCFTSKSNYVVHMRRHTGEMPYTCEVCGKGFPKSTDLNSHKITHTGERKFKCSFCQKAFARSAVLSKHMRVHAGPYHCTYCDQSFTRPNELATHLRRHASGQAYTCIECASCFNTKEQLAAHQQTTAHSNNRTVAQTTLTQSNDLITKTTTTPNERPELPLVVTQTELVTVQVTEVVSITAPLTPPITYTQNQNTFLQGAVNAVAYLPSTTQSQESSLPNQQQPGNLYSTTQWQ